MNTLVHPVTLLLLSGGAGMAAQEFVPADLWAPNDQAGVVSVESLTSWGTAKAYYAQSQLPHGVDQVPDEALGNGLHLDGTYVAAWIPEKSLNTRPAVIAQRKTRVPDKTPADASTLRILPPPTERVPRDHAVDRELGRPDRALTPPNIAPPSGAFTLPPSLTDVSSSASKRYLDAAELVRRRAAKKAAERRRRIEVRKWLGYSPLRPAVGAVPIMGGDSTQRIIILVPYAVDGRK
jgi:hypothetical protein